MSQQDRILYHLSRGEPITPLTALKEYGCFRLSSVIHRLKKDFDLDIITIMHEKYDYKEQGVKRYAEYHLRAAGLDLCTKDGYDIGKL
jgi:hypothetical protein